MLFDLLTFRWECIGGHLSVIEFADIWCSLHFVFALVLWGIILALIGGILWLLGAFR